MKKVFLLLALLITSSGFAKTINDQTCEVAVSKASRLFYTYSLTDQVLDKLVDRGYYPFNADSLSEDTSLYITWSVSCEDKWYGQKCTSKASLKKVLSNGRSVLLHSDKTTGSENLVDRLFARFPKCNY